MTTDNDFDAALTDLAAALRKKRKPSRLHARAILLALGERSLAGDPAVDAAERVRALVRERPADWERAVHEEIELAAVEFVRSVDPKYLDHPRYDFAYTIGARERLEARLAAAEPLGITVPDELLEQISAADSRLAPHLDRASERPPARGPGKGSRTRPDGPDRAH